MKYVQILMVLACVGSIDMVFASEQDDNMKKIVLCMPVEEYRNELSKLFHAVYKEENYQIDAQTFLSEVKIQKQAVMLQAQKQMAQDQKNIVQRDLYVIGNEKTHLNNVMISLERDYNKKVAERDCVSDSLERSRLNKEIDEIDAEFKKPQNRMNDLLKKESIQIELLKSFND